MPFPSKTTVDTDFTQLADILTPGTYTPEELKAVFHNNWNNILVYLNDIKAVLEATTADSGAHNIGSQAITGVTGANVHAQLTAIKALIDALPLDNTISTSKLVDLNVTNAKIAEGTITENKLVVGTLDNRYYTEGEVDTKLNEVVLGQIPDGSLTDVKLSDDVGQIKERFTLHKADNMPHKFTDGTTNYKYGLAIDGDFMKMIFEEVV